MLRYVLATILIIGCSRIEQPDETSTPDLPQPPSQQQPPSQPPNGDIVAQQQYMIFHNLKRCWHNANDIQWDGGLAESARQHAAKCTYRKDLTTRNGESLAVGQGLDLIKALDNWYIAGVLFPYNQPTGPDSMSEFSQMVWRGTERFGCASAACPNGNYYVCRYDAKGNIPGSYADNVRPLVPDFFKCSGLPR